MSILRELFRKQLEKPGRQLTFWPKVFYITYARDPGIWGVCLEVRSMPEAEIDSCGLIPAEDQSHLERGCFMPMLLDPELIKLWRRGPEPGRN